MIDLIRVLFEREIELADTVGKCRAIKVAYLGKNGIIKKVEGVLWNQ